MTDISELSSMVQAACGVLLVFGAGITALWRRVEKNHAHIFDINVKLAEMELSLKECERREDAGREQRSVMTTVIELLWQIAPPGAAKQRARWLLDTIRAVGIAFAEDEGQ